MLDRVRRKVVVGFAGALIIGLMGGSALAQEKFKAVTTFTVIADMAKNVAGDAAIVESITKPGAEIHNYQPTPGDIMQGAGRATRFCGTASTSNSGSRNSSSNLERRSRASSSREGVEPMGIAEGPYTGKPNPHAWMSPSAALIYVDNIRNAFVEHDPANAEVYKANAEAYKAQDQRGDRADPGRACRHSRREALAGVQRGRVLLSGARFRPEGTLSLADQRRPAGHAAAGAQGDRRGARQQDHRSSSPKARSPPARPSRWRARPARTMAACSMSTR